MSLRTEQVGEYVVSEAGMREAVRRVAMQKKVKELIDKGGLDEDTVTALSIYPHIAGCVTPLISVDQFMEMKETEIDALSETAMKFNPHWFALPKDAEEKKTDAQPPKPMRD